MSASTTTEQARLAGQVKRLKEKNKALRDKVDTLAGENKTLQKSLKETQKILRMMPGGIALIQDGRIIFANEALLNHLEFREEIVGLDFRDFIHPHYYDRIMGFYRNRISGRPAPDRYEAALLTGGDKVLHCEIRVSRIIHYGKRAFLVNITSLESLREEEQRRTEKAKRETLSSVAEGISRYLEECREQLRRYSETMKTDAPHSTPALDQALAGIRSVEQENARLTRELEILSKGSPGDKTMEVFYLGDTLKAALKRARKEWKAAAPGLDDKLRIKTYLRSRSPLEGSPEQIIEALSRVILNAAEAMPHGGEILLTTEEQAGFASVYIQDSGEGISEDIAEGVFDPFFTTKGSRSRGLGLSLTQTVVQRHGGRIDLLSTGKGGSTFVVYLPLAEEPAPKKPRDVRKIIRDSKVLLIAKEGMLKDLVAQNLNNKGCYVSEAFTGAEALRLMAKGAFNLVIADLDVSDLFDSGILYKAKKKARPLPVVLIDDGEGTVRRRDQGRLEADLVIERPVEMDKIHNYISTILKR